MSRSKLFNAIKSRGIQSNSRNVFDLSNAHAYSQKAGTITPIKAIHVIPDDFVNLSVRDFTQTLPMMSAPFLNARKELSAYFVPYNSLWHNYNQYQATREDPQSTLLEERGILFEPRIAVYDLYGVPFYFFMYYVFNEFCFAPYFAVHSTAYNWNRALEYAEDLKHVFDNAEMPVNNDGDTSFYEPFFAMDMESHGVGVDTIISTILSNPVGNPLGNLSPEEWYLNSMESASGAPQIGFFQDRRSTYKEAFKDVTGNYVWCNAIRKLDMLGYGNVYPLFKAALDRITTAYDNFVTELNENAFTHFCEETEMAFKVLQLQLGNVSASDHTVTMSPPRGKNVFLSPLPLFAYNKIFYDYYRNTYYDDQYHIRNYNADFIFSSTQRGSIISVYQLPARFWHLESHQYKKDMFTAVLPSTQFGAVSVLPLGFSTEGSTDLNDSYTVGGRVLSIEDGDLLADGSPSFHSHSFPVSGSVSLNPIELKRVEALQQFRQDLLRAGNRTEDIFKQIYGTEPKSQLSEKPYFIDAVSNDLNINPVISTADTQQGENGSLGDIASRAISSTDGDGLHSKFSTHDFGCIIILSTIIPESMYNSTMIDPHLANLTPEEHFIPHFMNLGFEPLYRMFLNNLKIASDRTNVVGFSLPYLEFKTDVDVCHGAFASMVSPYTTVQYLPHDFFGSLSQWVVARTDMQSNNVTELSSFYINPSVLDSVFVQDSGVDYESDQFLCYTQIKAPSVRQISELGLPDFL